MQNVSNIRRRKKEEKTNNSAYLWLVVGLLLGVLGAHRFYLHRYPSAMLMTGLFLIGVIIFVSDYLLAYISVIEQLGGALAAGGQAGNIPDITQIIGGSSGGGSQADNQSYAIAACSMSGLWWVLDWFLIPGMVRKFNKAQGE